LALLNSLSVWQHTANLGRVRVSRNCPFAQFSFPTRRFLRQNVARERVPPFDFAGRRYFEALCRASMGF